ncbi:MAG: AAA family ATPase [Anaerolineales bacterium]
MRFVIIFGPPAVGKMTVGYALQKLTGLRVFHNHMTIDLVLPFFEFGCRPFHRLVSEFRRRIFEEVAGSDLPGLIFTYVWVLDHPSDKMFIDEYCDIFREQGGQVYFVELEADLSERLRRNVTDFRLAKKPSKQDTQRSEANLLALEERYKMNSNGDFLYQENYVKINNTHLSPAETARKIAQVFGWPENVMR